MKLTTKLLAMVTLAIAASSVIAEAPVHRSEALPNGITPSTVDVYADANSVRTTGQAKDSLQERFPSIEDSQPINDEMVKRVAEVGSLPVIDSIEELVQSRGVNGKGSKRKHKQHQKKQHVRHRHSPQASVKPLKSPKNYDDDDGVSDLLTAHVKVSTNKVKNGQKSSQEWSSSKTIGRGGGLIGVKTVNSSCNCKQPNASEKHPNGSPEFLACGISKQNPNSGWCPPHVEMSQLKMASADEAANSNTFAPCKPYKNAFEEAERATGIPVVVLMSFALQESTCNPTCKGANGEVGMMQITPDKCQGDCWEPSTNIKLGGKYFASQLKEANGNFLKAAAAYNGWFEGLSYGKATSVQKSNCHAQQNLDYLNQLCNGFINGIDAYQVGYLSTFNNLGACSD